jgi:hypothetical protein
MKERQDYALMLVWVDLDSRRWWHHSACKVTSRLLFYQLMVTLTRFGIAMSTSSRSNLNDANDNGRKRQDNSDSTKDDGYRERVQGVGVGRGGRTGSVGDVGRASGRPEVRAKHICEVKVAWDDAGELL